MVFSMTTPLRRRNCFLVIVFVVFLPFCVFVLFNVPASYISKCSLSDPMLNDCMKEKANLAIPRLATGDTVLGIPAISPMAFAEAPFSGENVFITLIDTYTDDLKNLNITEISFDLNHRKIVIRAVFAHVVITAKNYTIHGKIIDIPVSGHGRYNLTLVNTKIEYRSDFGTYKKLSKKYLRLITNSVDLEVERGYFYFENIQSPIKDVTSEQMLLQRLAELQVKLQYLDSMYRAKQEDLQQLSHHIDQILVPVDNSTSYSPLAPSVKPEVKQMLRNMSGMNAANGINPPYMLRLPSSYHFLPHLLDDPTSLRLNYMLSKGRTGVSIVLGIPTVHREKQNYLMDTLTSLVDGMTTEESDDVVMVIFVAETELELVLQIAKEVEMRFPSQVDSGLIEVVSPSASYYPDMDKLRLTLGDSMERVRWRSKQNLDFAFLMSYCQPKGTFYVQLEDDILAKPKYISEMKKFAIDKIATKEPWFVLDFCQLGFIGKMFKSAELPWLIQFFQMFYNDKPVDWLLGDLIYTKVCNGDKNYDHCKKEKAERWIHYRPSLFQHIGTHSSLKGKVQKLKDKHFGKVVLFYPHPNPEAEVYSGIKCYKQYTLKRAYQGETFFWGLLPQAGDQLSFKFKKPLVLRRYFFRSGNAEHPSDKFYNTTVEVSLVNTSQYSSSLNVTSDGFVVIGKFDSSGIATANVDDNLGQVTTLRLHVHSDSDNWAILSEIHIQGDFVR